MKRIWGSGWFTICFKHALRLTRGGARAPYTKGRILKLFLWFFCVGSLAACQSLYIKEEMYEVFRTKQTRPSWLEAPSLKLCLFEPVTRHKENVWVYHRAVATHALDVALQQARQQALINAQWCLATKQDRQDPLFQRAAPGFFVIRDVYLDRKGGRWYDADSYVSIYLLVGWH